MRSFEFEATVKALSAAAALLDAGLDKPIWIPLSQLTCEEKEKFAVGDTLEFEIPEWLAKEKDLI